MSSGAGPRKTPTVGGVGDWGLGLGIGCYAVRYVGKFMQQKGPSWVVPTGWENLKKLFLRVIDRWIDSFLRAKDGQRILRPYPVLAIFVELPLEVIKCPKFHVFFA